MTTHNAAMILREEPTNRVFLASLAVKAASPPPQPLKRTSTWRSFKAVNPVQRFVAVPQKLLLAGQPVRSCSGPRHLTTREAAVDLGGLESSLPADWSTLYPYLPTTVGLSETSQKYVLRVPTLLPRGRSPRSGASRSGSLHHQSHDRLPGKLRSPIGNLPVGKPQDVRSGGDFLPGRTSDPALDYVLLRYLPRESFSLPLLNRSASAEVSLRKRAADTKARVEHFLPTSALLCIYRYAPFHTETSSLVSASPILEDPVFLRYAPIARRNGYSFLLVAIAFANQADVSSAVADCRYAADAEGHPQIDVNTPLPHGGIFFLEPDGSVHLPLVIEGYEFEEEEERSQSSWSYGVTTDPSAACIGFYRPQLHHPSSVVATASFLPLPSPPQRESEREEDSRLALHSVLFFLSSILFLLGPVHRLPL
eukprot:gene12091-8317_t